MKITLSPQRRNDALTVTKAGDMLTINGEPFDFSDLPDGATIPAGEVPSEWIVGPVDRVSGELRLTLILPHGPNPEPWQSFPESIVSPADGELDLPWDTYQETSREPVTGGTRVTVTTYRWRRPPTVEATTFIPSPPKPEEPGDVEA